MTDSDWTRISAIGQAVAAIISMLALLGLLCQIRMTRKAADLQALQDFVRRADEREHRLLQASTDEARDQAFFEFLNFLESSAGALNDGLFPATTKRLVTAKIRDSIVIIDGAEAWHPKFVRAITTGTTFSEIGQFMGRHRAEIGRIGAMKRALAAAETSAVQDPS